MKRLAFWLLSGSALAMCACVKHEVEVKPVKVEPIHVTVDVNLNVQIDQKLEKFFDYAESPDPKAKPDQAPEGQSPSSNAGDADHSSKGAHA